MVNTYKQHISQFQTITLCFKKLFLKILTSFDNSSLRGEKMIYLKKIAENMYIIMLDKVKRNTKSQNSFK